MPEPRNGITKSVAIHEDLTPLLRLRDGWDGEEGKPPNECSLFWATVAIEKSKDRGIAPTSIIPCADDGVSILFANGGKSAAIECFNSGELSAAISAGSGQTEAWDIANHEEDMERAVERIRAFLG